MYTIRYFMAHAPAEPQPWFKPTMKESRPQRLFRDYISGTTFVSLSAASAYGCDMELVDCSNRDQIDDWDQEYIKQKYIQWPLAWALEVSKTLGQNHE